MKKTKTKYDWTTHKNINRPIDKLLRALQENKTYIFFDRWAIYFVTKKEITYDHESYEPYESKAQAFHFVNIHNHNERFFISEKSTADMPPEYIESHDDFKHTQHSRRYKALVKQGFAQGSIDISLPINNAYSSNYLCFAGEYNKEKISTIETLRTKNTKWLFNIQLQERLSDFKLNKTSYMLRRGKK